MGVILAERPSDLDAIRPVNRLAFGGEDEARLVEALRDVGHAKVSLVAEDDGQVVGHILYTELPILMEAGTVEAVSPAPSAVIPSHGRRGIGSMRSRPSVDGDAAVDSARLPSRWPLS
jgi:putative acetyltransferase